MGEFEDAVNEYMDEYELAYAESTVKARRRELMQICRIVESLEESGRISTQDPAEIGTDDVKVIAARIKHLDISSNTRGHMLGRLNMVCKFMGNWSVEHAKVRYPTLFPPKKETRLGVLSMSDYRKVIDFANMEGHSYRQLRSCVSVILPLATGIRPQETRMVMDRDIDLDRMCLYVSSPKGSDSYGINRTIPIHPDAVPVIGRFLEEFHGSGRMGYIFQGPDGLPVEGNTQRKWRQYVIDGTGVELDHRILRRTWGQMLEDQGVPEEYVSVLLGHASTETTARYYARVSERKAIEEVRRIWDTKETTEKEGSARSRER